MFGWIRPPAFDRSAALVERSACTRGSHARTRTSLTVERRRSAPIFRARARASRTAERRRCAKIFLAKHASPTAKRRGSAQILFNDQQEEFYSGAALRCPELFESDLDPHGAAPPLSRAKLFDQPESGWSERLTGRETFRPLTGH